VSAESKLARDKMCAHMSHLKMNPVLQIIIVNFFASDISQQFLGAGIGGQAVSNFS
jgi:hypothetical protein